MCARFLRPYAHPRMHPNQFCYHQLDQIYYLGLLDRCTTKHEVQTLLQTKMDSGHMDANFNIAILDCHKVGVAFFLIESNDNKCPGKHEKEFVAHEKFQQMLHKKWGQRDRALPVGGSGVRGYNIFWYGITKSYVLCPKLMLARGWRMLQAS